MTDISPRLEKLERTYAVLLEDYQATKTGNERLRAALATSLPKTAAVISALKIIAYGSASEPSPSLDECIEIARTAILNQQRLDKD